MCTLLSATTHHFRRSPSIRLNRTEGQAVAHDAFACIFNAPEVTAIQHTSLLVDCIGSWPSLFVLRPSRLSCLPKRLASNLRANISPARRAKPNRLTFYWRWRQFSTGDIEHLKSEINKHLCRQSALTNDSLERHGATDAQTGR